MSLLRILLVAALLGSASVAVAGAGPEVPACVEEPELSVAAAELLLDVAASDQAPSDEALALAVRRAGSDAVGVRALLVRVRGRAALARRDAWLHEAAERADAPLVCGHAQSPQLSLWLLATRAGRLEPLAEAQPVVRGELAPRFQDAALVVVDGYGELQRIAVSSKQLREGMPIAPELARPIRVQLVAAGPVGPRPVAERVLGHVELAASAKLAGAQADALGEPDLTPRDQLTVARSRAGQKPLRDSSLLERVATEHAQRVCAEGRIAHELSRGEDPKQRLQAAGVVARRVGETIARDGNARRAFDRMLHSPSHRLTLLERGFTDVGFGAARDARGRECLVVLLAEWPRFVGK